MHSLKSEPAIVMTHPAQPTASKEFIAMMAVLMSVVAISIDAMLPALGIIGKAMGVTHPNQAQYLISCIFLGMAIGQLICGPLSDAIGRKNILYGSISLYLVGSVMCLLARSIEVMLLGRFIQGLGVAGPNVACISIVRDRFSGRPMARMMSLVMMIFIMVPVIAPAIGQSLMLVSSWHAIFVLYIVYALAVLLWITLRLPETLLPENRIPFRIGTILHSAKRVVTNRRTIIYTICMGFTFGAMIGDLNSAQQIFQVQFGVGEMFVVYFGLQALAFGAASLVNARMVERLGMRYICLHALSVMSGTSLLFLALHAIIPITFWWFFFYGVILLFCIGLLFGNLNALALEPMGDIAGTAAAIIGATSISLAIPLGTLIGQLYDGTLIPLASGFALLGLGALGLMLWVEKR